LALHVFSVYDPGFVSRAQEKGGGIIVGGDNYGQGSSREHAALAPAYLGVQMVSCISIARLHRANLINFGILPVLIDKEAYAKIEQGDRIECSDIRNAVACADHIDIVIPAKGTKISGRLELSQRERKILLAGGMLNYMKNILSEQKKHE
jgi:aconitate hydratase